MNARNARPVVREVAHRVMVLAGASMWTLACFLVLPLIQSLNAGEKPDRSALDFNVAHIPPPPPPPPEEEEPEPDEKPEEQPPELVEQPEMLDLSQLELLMDSGMGSGMFSGDFAVKLNTVAAKASDDIDAMISMSDLDQRPQVIYQPSPVLSTKLRKRTPATVKVMFIVDRDGRVENPRVARSTDSAFDRIAVSAVKKWKFEPGKRDGEPVEFRMKIDVTFPKGP